MRQYGIGTGLPDTPIGLGEDDTKLLMPLYRSMGSLASNLSDLTGMTVIPGVDIQQSDPLLEHDRFRTRKLNFKAQEAIGYGRLVHLDNTVGESQIWLADSSPAVLRAAHGVCVEPGGIISGQRGRVQLFQGLLTSESGLTPGTIYWLGAVGGVLPASPGSGWLQQKVALAITPTSYMLNISL